MFVGINRRNIQINNLTKENVSDLIERKNDYDLMRGNAHDLMRGNDHNLMRGNVHDLIGENDHDLMRGNAHDLIGENDHDLMRGNSEEYKFKFEEYKYDSEEYNFEKDIIVSPRSKRQNYRVKSIVEIERKKKRDDLSVFLILYDLNKFSRDNKRKKVLGLIQTYLITKSEALNDKISSNNNIKSAYYYMTMFNMQKCLQALYK